MPMNCIRVVVVDDQTLIREGIVALLGMVSDIDVVGAAENGRDSLDLVTQQSPDVVLMDARMPGMDGIAATQQISRRFPEVKVIILTTFKEDALVLDALAAGAAGYLLKNADLDELAAAVRHVYSGKSILSPDVTGAVIRRARLSPRQQPPWLQSLSPREYEALQALVTGANNAEIAARLHLAEGTVKNHISRILHKMGVRNRAQAIRLALSWGVGDE